MTIFPAAREGAGQTFSVADPNSPSETIREVGDDTVHAERFHSRDVGRLVDGVDEHGEMCAMESVY